MILQKGVMSLTVASSRHLWSGPIASRPAGDLATHLAADTASLLRTAAIIAGENPVADPRLNHGN